MANKTNRKYYNMTEAEILRSLPNSEINRYAKRGAPNAILEQAYRMQMRHAIADHVDELSEFERCCLVEAEIRMKGGI